MLVYSIHMKAPMFAGSLPAALSAAAACLAKYCPTFVVAPCCSTCSIIAMSAAVAPVTRIYGKLPQFGAVSCQYGVPSGNALAFLGGAPGGGGGGGGGETSSKSPPGLVTIAKSPLFEFTEMTYSANNRSDCLQRNLRRSWRKPTLLHG